ncbi:MAG: hypothetical protein HQL54_01040 [Magnetococcales bacterium]|nr:hypothetical protein [Magnetococcales bacterium]
MADTGGQNSDSNGSRRSTVQSEPVKMHRPWFLRLLKGIGWSVLTVVALLVVILIAGQTYLSSEPFRKQAEQLLSEQLGQPVVFGAFSFSFFNGFIIQDLHAQMMDVGRVDLGEAVLIYDLTDLIQGRISIGEIRLSDTEIWLNLPGLSALTAQAATEPVEPVEIEGPTELAIPLSIAMKKWTLNNVSVQVDVQEGVALSLESIGLEMVADVTPELITLEGLLDILTIQADLDGKTVSLPFSSVFDLSLLPIEQKLDLHRLLVGSEGMVQTVLSGSVEALLTEPELLLDISESQLDLKQILAFVAPMLPPDMPKIDLSGLVHPHVAISGVLNPTGFNGTAQVSVTGSALDVVVPDQQVSVTGGVLSVKSEPITLQNNTPGVIKASGAVQLAAVGLPDVAVDQLNLNWTVLGGLTGPIEAGVDLAIENTVVIIGDERIETPVSVELRAEAEPAATKAVLKRLALTLGPMLQMDVTGRLDPNDTDGYSASALALVTPTLKPFLEKIPKKLIPEGIYLAVHDDEPDRITVEIRSQLAKDFLPVTAHVQGESHLHGLSFKDDNSGAAAQLDTMKVRWVVDYLAAQKSINGTLSAITHVKQLMVDRPEQTEDRIDLADFILNIDSTLTADLIGETNAENSFMPSGLVNAGAKTLISGKLSDLDMQQGMRLASMRFSLNNDLTTGIDRDGKPQGLKARQALSVGLTQLSLIQDGIDARIPEMALALQAHEDLDQGDLVLDRLSLDAQEWLKTRVTGEFNTNSTRFKADASLDRLNPASLFKQIKLNPNEPPAFTISKGALTAYLNASGKLPKSFPPGTKIFNALTLDLKSGADWKKVSVQAAGHSVNAFSGNVDLNGRFRPKSNSTALNSAFSIQSVSGIEGLPKHQARDIKADLALTGTDLNHWTLKNAAFSLGKTHATLSGRAGGLKAVILDGATDLPTLLSRVFADLTAKVNLNIADLLPRVVGDQMSGQGSESVTVTVRKRDNGDLSLDGSVRGKAVSIQMDGLGLSRMNGGFRFHKTLKYAEPGSNNSVDKKRTKAVGMFNPVGILAGLRRHSGIGQGLSIDQLDLGWLQVDHLSADIHFDGRKLWLQNAGLDALGGSAGLDFILESGDPFGFTMSLEEAQMDLNKLLGERQRIAGDGTVDMVVRMKTQISGEQRRLDWARTRLDLDITRIGKQALDRLLLFLDPEESNPGLVTARAKLQLANPSKVGIYLSKGIMSLSITFQEGLIGAFQMDRIPVAALAGLKGTEQLAEVIGKLATLMNLVGAQWYGVDENGTLQLW